MFFLVGSGGRGRKSFSGEPLPRGRSLAENNMKNAEITGADLFFPHFVDKLSVGIEGQKQGLMIGARLAAQPLHGSRPNHGRMRSG